MARNTRGLKRGAGPGRPKGSRNSVPGSFKQALRETFADIHSDDPKLIRRAIEKGLRSAPPKSYKFIELCLHYSLGKPSDKLELSGEIQLPMIVNHFSDEPAGESD